MTDQTIICPHCQEIIPLTQALTHQIESTAMLKVEAEKQKLAEEQKRFEAKLKEEQTQVETLRQELIKQQKELTIQVDEAVTKKLSSEKRALWIKAQAEAAKQQNLKLKDLESTLEEQNKKLYQAELAELEIRKRARALEERERQLEIETERRLATEKEKIRQETIKQETESTGLKLAEKDKQLDILRKTIENLRRQSEQGSQQVQGEVGEGGLKELLTISFPKDKIEDVPTGAKGADLVQHVNANLGQFLATIVWESKNQKSFTDDWLSKLKKDQGLVKAEVAILVTKVLPKELTNFGMVKQVWVTLPQYAVALATTLRLQLIELAKLKRSLEGQDEKMTTLYQYLTGPQFKNRVENLVMAFVGMQQELEKERRSLTNIWKRREGQIQRMLETTANMYGEFQGIIGGGLPSIQQLELDDALAEETKKLPEQSLFDEKI